MSANALNSAVAGLSVTQARINTLSRNIANAGNEGYSRKVQDAITGPTGAPFTVPLKRQVDEALTLAVREAAGEQSRLEVRVELLSQIEAQFGRPEDNASLPGAIKRLEAAFRDVQTSPEKSTLYATLVGVADDVARSFDRLYERTEAVRIDTLNRIDQAVSDVNNILENIRQLNVGIASGGVDRDATDLEDSRDKELLKLAQLLDFTTFKQANGAIAIYTKQGVPLLDHSVRPISSTSIGTQPAVSPAPPIVVVKSGALGALLRVRDTDLPAIQGQLDDMARALTVEFRSAPVSIELFNDGGALALDPLDPVQMNGYARRIAVNALIRATPTLIRDGSSAVPLELGDTTFIDEAVALFGRTDVAFTASTGLPAAGGFAQVAADFVAAHAASREDASSRLEHQKALKESFETKLSAETGVNIDQEMAALIAFQQAYAANARVVQTTKELLDQLLLVR